MMNITNEKVEQYLIDLMPMRDKLLIDIQQQGIKDEIPIIQVASLNLIKMLLRPIKPQIIIELGTAIAFSTIWLAKVFPNTTIHTIERNPQMIEKAKANIRKAGLEDQIILHEGQAVNILPTLPKAEFIFIDAAKGKYKEFYELAYPLLKQNGLLVFDNILFRGYVADEEIYKTKPMLRKIRAFNEFIATKENIETSFVPVGDGLAICYKTEE